MERRSPEVWVRELRVLNELRDGQDAIVRQIPLRTGLNILWAKPATSDVSGGLFEGGLSGHAAGKTTFCRLLRYILGEPTYGDDRLRSAIRNRFPKGWVVAEVIIRDNPWIVCRPLGLGAHPFVVKGRTIDDLFDPGSVRDDLDSYLDALNGLIPLGDESRKLWSIEEPIGWLHVLPWLARDQECRFSSLIEWRDAVSQSGTPQLDTADRQVIFRTILGLLSGEENQEQRNHQHILSQRKRAREQAQLLAHQSQVDRNRLETEFGRTMPPFDDGLFRQAIRDELTTLERTIRQPYESRPSDQGGEDLREALEEAIRRESRAQDAFNEVREQLTIEEGRLRVLGQAISNQARSDWIESLPAPRGICNRPIEMAIEHGCPLAEPPTFSLAQERATKLLDRGAVDWQEVVEGLKRVASQRQAEWESCKQALVTARMRTMEYRMARDEETRRLSEDLLKIGVLRSLADHAEASWNQSIDCDQSFENLEDALRESNEKQRVLREGHRTTLKAISEHFDHAIRAVLGDFVSGIVDFSGRDITLRVEYQGERKSAAIESIKIVAFDLAAMTSSIEGQGTHPRFLVHDGPREADMAVDVYRKFFLFVRELERCFPPGVAPSFQYILTTTEAPPAELLMSPWLLEPILDASTPEGRLLGVNL